MMETFVKIFIVFLITLSCFSSENIDVYIGEDKFNKENKSNIVEIIKCVFPNDKKISLNYIPSIRTEYLLNNTKRSIIYPFASKDRLHDKYHFVGPVAIDEILLVSNKKNKNRSLGIVRGSLFYGFVYKNLNFKGFNKDLYEVNDTESLIKGFLLDRVDSIVIKRVDLHKVSKYREFSVQSLGFFETAVAISKSYDELVGGVQDSFSKCVINKNTLISDRDKEDIVSAVKKILLKLPKVNKSKISKDKKSAQDIDLSWRANSPIIIKLKEMLLENDTAISLKEFQKNNSFIKEAFTFDNSGHVTAMTNVISNFDQSSEKKFKVVKDNMIFSTAHVNNIGYDESSNIFNISVTYPLYKKNKFEGGIHLVFEINGLIDYICSHIDKDCKIRKIKY